MNAVLSLPLFAGILLAACAGQPAKPAANSASSRYPGTCALIGIDEVPAAVDQEGDSVALIARYRFGETASASRSAWALQFQVARSRAHDLRQHLESHPTVVCNPDNQAGGDQAGRVDVPLFEGQRGQPVP